MTGVTEHLPADWRDALLLGRLELAVGPTPVLVRKGRVLDISGFAATTADAVATPGLDRADGVDLGPLDEMDFAVSWDAGSAGATHLLSPLDLQCVKASGVTFAVSAVERVIEERARGDAERAQDIRSQLAERVGADLSAVRRRRCGSRTS